MGLYTVKHHASAVSGEFGIVYRGQIIKLVGGKTSVEIVAVKTLKGISFGVVMCTMKKRLHVPMQDSTTAML